MYINYLVQAYKRTRLRTFTWNIQLEVFDIQFNEILHDLTADVYIDVYSHNM